MASDDVFSKHTQSEALDIEDDMVLAIKRLLTYSSDKRTEELSSLQDSLEDIASSLSAIKKALPNVGSSVSMPDNFEVVRPYRDKLMTYTADATNAEEVRELLLTHFVPRYFNMPLLHSEKRMNKFLNILKTQPLLLVGPSGVGKNILQEQLIRAIAGHLFSPEHGKRTLYRNDIDFHENTMVSEVCDMQSISTNRIVIGAVEECIIKANEIWFGEANRTVADIESCYVTDANGKSSYSFDTDIVISIWNEVTRNEGYAFRKLYSFLSRRGATIQIGNKLYYNTPNLIILMNGNTAVNGMHLDMSILDDEAFTSRVHKEDIWGVLQDEDSIINFVDYLGRHKPADISSTEFDAVIDITKFNIWRKKYADLCEAVNSGAEKKLNPCNFVINMRRALTPEGVVDLEYFRTIADKFDELG